MVNTGLRYKTHLLRSRIMSIENTFNSVFHKEPKDFTKEVLQYSAKEGNFINKDEILLNKNVKFKSNDFSIETEKVIFNRNKQTARSQTKSLFKSENTKIFSEGFNIYDRGNVIEFFGNSNILLK